MGMSRVALIFMAGSLTQTPRTLAQINARTFCCRFVGMPPRPERPENSYWQPVSQYGLAAFLLGTAWLIFLLATDDDGFIQIVDSFNLVIHEFGHPFFS